LSAPAGDDALIPLLLGRWPVFVRARAGKTLPAGAEQPFVIPRVLCHYWHLSTKGEVSATMEGCTDGRSKVEDPRSELFTRR